MYHHDWYIFKICIGFERLVGQKRYAGSNTGSFGWMVRVCCHLKKKLDLASLPWFMDQKVVIFASLCDHEPFRIEGVFNCGWFRNFW
jgi:hypothetical protein